MRCDIGGTVSVQLGEDDGDAMAKILSALHHDTHSISVPTDLEAIVSIAAHCDKYDCSSVMKPWVAQWLLELPLVQASSVNLGLQIFIAFNL